MKNRLAGWLALVLVPVMAAALLMAADQRGAVAWRPLRAVVFESDDWGLAGFIPTADSWRGLDREELKPGPFPDVYWQSTLEDSATVAALCAVLEAHRGRDGRPAVFQPNYVMSSLGLAEDGRTWQRYDWPRFPPQYVRPGLGEAVAAGIRSGIWYPEFHATWHYDPDRRRRQTTSSEVALEAARRGILLFPEMEKARELGPWRDMADLEAELDDSLARFESVFGRPPGATIAPDYSWNGRIEALWRSRGIRVIQAKREQRNPDYGADRVGRLRKYLERQWARVFRPELIYLERNCRLEPVQAPDPQAVVAACLRDIRKAWRDGRPAVVETHRINFAHTDPAVVRSGLESLASVVDALVQDPDALPTFLTDMELAQLARRGTSACARGGVVIVRNESRTRRIVTVPVGLLRQAAAQAGLAVSIPEPLLCLLAPGRDIELVPGQHFAAQSSHR